MKISITDLAKDYIQRKGIEELHVYLNFSIGCTITFRPLIKTGKPEDVASYEEYEVDGVKVYYSEELGSEEDFTIGYQKIGEVELLVPGGDRK